MTDFRRNLNYIQATIHNTPASAEAVEMAEYSGGSVCCGAGISVASIAIYARDPQDGSFYPATNSAGTALTITPAASTCVALPAEVFSFDAIKLVPSTSGDDGETVTVVLKS